MRFSTMWYVRPAKAQINLRIRSVRSEPLLVVWIFYECYICKLLTEQHIRFLSLKGGCTGSYESIHVKIQPCWKSHVTAHIFFTYFRAKTARTVRLACAFAVCMQHLYVLFCQPRVAVTSCFVNKAIRYL